MQLEVLEHLLPMFFLKVFTHAQFQQMVNLCEIHQHQVDELIDVILSAFYFFLPQLAEILETAELFAVNEPLFGLPDTEVLIKFLEEPPTGLHLAEFFIDVENIIVFVVVVACQSTIIVELLDGFLKNPPLALPALEILVFILGLFEGKVSQGLRLQCNPLLVKVFELLVHGIKTVADLLFEFLNAMLDFFLVVAVVL